MLYGYKIVDGRAVVDRAAHKKIQLLFRNYLAGMSLSKAAEKAGIHIPHGWWENCCRTSITLETAFIRSLSTKAPLKKQQWHEGIAHKSWGGQT